MPGKETEPQRRDKPRAWLLGLLAALRLRDLIHVEQLRYLCRWRNCERGMSEALVAWRDADGDARFAKIRHDVLPDLLDHSP